MRASVLPLCGIDADEPSANSQSGFTRLYLRRICGVISAVLYRDRTQSERRRTATPRDAC
ncbi:MAG: hypothetical protein ABJB61_07695 [bacterium]